MLIELLLPSSNGFLRLRGSAVGLAFDTVALALRSTASAFRCALSSVERVRANLLVVLVGVVGSLGLPVEATMLVSGR